MVRWVLAALSCRHSLSITVQCVLRNPVSERGAFVAEGMVGNVNVNYMNHHDLAAGFA